MSPITLHCSLAIAYAVDSKTPTHCERSVVPGNPTPLGERRNQSYRDTSNRPFPMIYHGMR